MHQIGTIISYCTNDYRFIDKCIEEAKKFSKQILIPVCDHFFDGTPENRHLLEHTYANHPDCQFIEFAYMTDRTYSRYHMMKDGDPDWSMYWGASTRYIGYHYLDPSIDTVFFLDSDEIVEADRFIAWLGKGQLFAAQRLAAYFYALKPNMRAKNVVNLPLLVQKDTLAPLTLINELDRIGAYLTHPGPKQEEVVGTNGLPFVHHYSWVRTKEECLHKTRTWGHRHDEDWPKLIEEAFSGQTKGLFGSTHEFQEIREAYFDPFKVQFPKEKAPSYNNVLRINESDFFKKVIEHALI